MRRSLGLLLPCKAHLIMPPVKSFQPPIKTYRKPHDHISTGKQASHAEQVGQYIPNPIFHFAALISNTSARVIVAMRFALLLASFSLASAIACAASRHWIT
jgi:hypothetical protein